MSACLLADLGGAPMIDDQASASVIATLACSVRQRLDGKRHSLDAYLQPERARECYRNAVTLPITECESVNPTGEEMETILATCDEIVFAVPAWKTYFAIPLCWRRLLGDLFSSSNPLIPQHIYLGKRGIRSHRLAEYIVHEISHTWVGMVAEIAPLALPGKAIHVLPSGTSNKEIRQVMYALTFAATAIRFYRARITSGPDHVEDIERLAYLERYAAGCLDILEGSELLLPNGRLMADSCHRMLHS